MKYTLFTMSDPISLRFQLIKYSWSIDWQCHASFISYVPLQKSGHGILYIYLLVSIHEEIPVETWFCFSARISSRQERSADRDRDQGPVPQVQGALPQPANPTRAGSASQNLRWVNSNLSNLGDWLSLTESKEMITFTCLQHNVVPCFVSLQNPLSWELWRVLY